MESSQSEVCDLLRKFHPRLKEKEVETISSISELHLANNKEIILNSGKIEKSAILILKGVERACRNHRKRRGNKCIHPSRGKIYGRFKSF